VGPPNGPVGPTVPSCPGGPGGPVGPRIYLIRWMRERLVEVDESLSQSLYEELELELDDELLELELDDDDDELEDDELSLE
jgi:hypothetical protein